MRLLNHSKVSIANVDFAVLILRITAGALMLYGHGYPKLMMLMGGGEIQFTNFLGLGVMATLILTVIAEVVCAVFLIFGLFTRLSTIPLIIAMVYAAFVFHAGDDFVQAQEKPILFIVAYLSILLIGPGRYSLDRMIGSKRKR